MESISYWQLLSRNKNYRNLWIGQVISELGTWFSFIAEIGTIGMMSDSPLAIMLLLVSRLLPVLFIAPLAGVLVDRFSRKKILIFTDLIRAVIALGFLTAGFGAPMWFIILCSGLMSATGQLFDSAKNAAIANMVSRAEMLTANVLMFSLRFLLLSVGAALGGAAAAAFGYKTAFIINSLSFTASAFFVSLIPARVMHMIGNKNKSSSHSEPVKTKFFKDIIDGFAYIKNQTFVRALILVNIGWGMGGGMTNLIYAEISKREFALTGVSRDASLAVLFVASSLGLLIGMLIARRIALWITNERRATHFIGWGLILHGCTFSFAAGMPSLVSFAILILISRFILGAEFGVQETLMMRVVPDEFRGRVFTTDRALDWSSMAFSMIAAGFLLTKFHPRVITVLSGILTTVPGIVWLFAMWRHRFQVPSAAIRESYAVPSD